MVTVPVSQTPEYHATWSNVRPVRVSSTAFACSSDSTDEDSNAPVSKDARQSKMRLLHMLDRMQQVRNPRMIAPDILLLMAAVLTAWGVMHSVLY